MEDDVVVGLQAATAVPWAVEVLVLVLALQGSPLPHNNSSHSNHRTSNRSPLVARQSPLEVSQKFEVLMADRRVQLLVEE